MDNGRSAKNYVCMAKAIRAGVRLGPVALPQRNVVQRLSSGAGLVARRGLEAVRSLFAPAWVAARPALRDSRIDKIADKTVQLGRQDVLLKTPYGRLIVPAEDEVLLTALLDTGVLEPGTTIVMTQLIREGDLVVDVGANIGLLTLPAARRVGTTGSVMAFEPLPRLADVLRRSMYINGISDRVSVVAAACGDQSGTATMHAAKILGHSSLLPVEGEIRTLEVPLRTLDECIPAHARVSLVKIDAEGYELSVWRGMRRIIGENPDVAVIVEFGPSHLARAGITIAAWLEPFVSDGFSGFEIDEATGQCRALRTSGLDEVFSINLLFLRRPQSSYPNVTFA